MSRTVTLALAAFALVAVSGCDEQVLRATQAHTGPAALKDDGGSTDAGGECVSCAKFRARPPSGINTPPRL
jgi:hypothetical protein